MAQKRAILIDEIACIAGDRRRLFSLAKTGRPRASVL